MVAAGEGPVTVVALEGAIARVLPVVAGELVGSGETPVTPRPRALVGLLT